MTCQTNQNYKCKMNYQDLAQQINKRVKLGIKTPEDEKEFFALDKELRTFVNLASRKDFNDFRRLCYSHETFSMIAARLIYEKNIK